MIQKAAWLVVVVVVGGGDAIDRVLWESLHHQRRRRHGPNGRTFESEILIVCACRRCQRVYGKQKPIFCFIQEDPPIVTILPAATAVSALPVDRWR